VYLHVVILMLFLQKIPQPSLDAMSKASLVALVMVLGLPLAAKAANTTADANTTAAATTAGATTAAGATTTAAGTTAVPPVEIKGTIGVTVVLDGKTAQEYTQDAFVKAGFATAIAKELPEVNPEQVVVTITERTAGGGRRLATSTDTFLTPVKSSFVVSYVITIAGGADSETTAQSIAKKIEETPVKKIQDTVKAELSQTTSAFEDTEVTVDSIEKPSVTTVTTTNAISIGGTEVSNSIGDRVAILALLTMFLSLWQ